MNVTPARSSFVLPMQAGSVIVSSPEGNTLLQDCLEI